MVANLQLSGHLATFTQFAMGRIDGGGYNFNVTASDDGINTLLLARNDEEGAFRYSSGNPAGARWTSCAAGRAISGRTLNTTLGCYEAVWGPKTGGTPCAAMVISPTIATQGAGGQNNLRQTLYYSTDGALTFTPTALTGVSGYQDYCYSGNKIVIDPNNPLIIYVIYINGVIKYTFNGGANWHTGTALLGALLHTTANGAALSNASTININGANPLNPLSTTISYAGFDLQNELALGSNGGYDIVSAATSSTISVTRVQPNDGSSGNGKTGIVNGDDLYFGQGCCVAIDGSRGTIANPGTDPGCTGVASKVVYFGFGHTGMWWTWDGNPEHAAAMPAGGYANLNTRNPSAGRIAGGRINVSFDGTMYVITGSDSKGKSFVPDTPLAGTGTWTDLFDTGGAQLNLVPHPTVAGKVAWVSHTGGIEFSLNYGASVASSMTSQIFVSGDGGTDTPWGVGQGDMFSGGAGGAWDPLNTNRIFCSTGVGVYYTDCPSSAGAWPNNNQTTQNAGLESLIVTDIRKAPSPNGNILMACLDRPVLVATSPTVAPGPNLVTGISPPGAIVCTYSESDPTVVWTSDASATYKNTNKGTFAGDWTLITGIDFWSDIASTTPNSAVFNSNATQNIKYTADGGTTVTDCLFDGSVLLGDSGGSFSEQHMLTQDGTNYYYLRKGNGKLYKSTDGGSHFTTISTQSLNIGNTARLLAVKGTSPLELLFVSGSDGGHGWDVNWPLMRLVNPDGGGAFVPISNVYNCTGGDWGKAAPGKSYTTYIVAQLTQFATWGLYRCDDLSASPPVWTELTDAKRVCCDVLGAPYSAGSAVWGDKETYGSVFVATSGSGYMYGKLI